MPPIARAGTAIVTPTRTSSETITLPKLRSAFATIGTIRTFTRLGVGILLLDSRQGTDIPGDSLFDLSGQDVEVRAADGTVVLTGRFPNL